VVGKLGIVGIGEGGGKGGRKAESPEGLDVPKGIDAKNRSDSDYINYRRDRK
jgi:hypothetical protein